MTNTPREEDTVIHTGQPITHPAYGRAVVIAVRPNGTCVIALDEGGQREVWQSDCEPLVLLRV